MDFRALVLMLFCVTGCAEQQEKDLACEALNPYVGQRVIVGDTEAVVVYYSPSHHKLDLAINGVREQWVDCRLVSTRIVY